MQILHNKFMIKKRFTKLEPKGKTFFFAVLDRVRKCYNQSVFFFLPSVFPMGRFPFASCPIKKVRRNPSQMGESLVVTTAIRTSALYFCSCSGDNSKYWSFLKFFTLGDSGKRTKREDDSSYWGRRQK